MSDDKFLSLVYKGNLVKIYSFLRKHSYSPFNAKDSRGYSALHVATLNSSTSVVKFLVRYTQENFANSQETLTNWVNLRSQEGFTCLHLAAFRGNMVTQN